MIYNSSRSHYLSADLVKPHFTYDDYCESADMIAAHLGDFRPGQSRKA